MNDARDKWEDGVAEKARELYREIERLSAENSALREAAAALLKSLCEVDKNARILEASLDPASTRLCPKCGQPAGFSQLCSHDIHSMSSVQSEQERKVAIRQANDHLEKI